MERLRQSGGLSNAFGMEVFLKSKKDLLCDHPWLFIMYVILIYYVSIIIFFIVFTSSITILIPMPFVSFCLDISSKIQP